MKIELKILFNKGGWCFKIPGQEYVLVNEETRNVIKNLPSIMKNIYDAQPALKRFHSRFFKRFP